MYMQANKSRMAMGGLIALVSLLFTVAATAGPVVTTADLVPGTPATAGDINTKIDNIVTAVNDNDSRISQNGQAVVTSTNNSDAISDLKAIFAILRAKLNQFRPVVLDGNDVEIGFLVNIDDDNQFIDVLTQEGYIIDGLSLGDGGLDRFTSVLSFSTLNCSGPAFSRIPNGFVRSAYDLSGVAVLHYVAKDSIALTNVFIGSESGAGGCVALLAPVPFVTISFAWPTMPNDSNITGVAASTYQVPIKIQAP